MSRALTLALALACLIHQCEKWYNAKKAIMQVELWRRHFIKRAKVSSSCHFIHLSPPCTLSLTWPTVLIKVINQVKLLQYSSNYFSRGKEKGELISLQIHRQLEHQIGKYYWQKHKDTHKVFVCPCFWCSVLSVQLSNRTSKEITISKGMCAFILVFEDGTAEGFCNQTPQPGSCFSKNVTEGDDFENVKTVTALYPTFIWKGKIEMPWNYPRIMFIFTLNYFKIEWNICLFHVWPIHMYLYIQ